MMDREEIESKAREVYPEDITRIPQDPYPPMEIDNNAHKREGYINALTEIESLPKIHGWVARDKWNYLSFFTGSKPYETVDGLWATIDGDAIELDENLFPEQFCTCEPAEVELLIRKL